MFFINNAYITVMNAQEVANAVHHFVSTQESKKFFKLLVTTAKEDGVREFLVRPILEQDFLPNADGGEIIHCVTDDDQKIDLILPHPKERQLFPAGVLTSTERTES